MMTATRHPEVRDPVTGAGYRRAGTDMRGVEEWELVTATAGALKSLGSYQRVERGRLVPWADKPGDHRLLTEDQIREWVRA